MSHLTPCHHRNTVGLLLLAAVTAACGGHHLADYDFRDTSLAIVADLPATPGLETGGWYGVDTSNPLRAALEVGGRVAREVQAREAAAHLDSAAVLADMEGILIARTHERAARYLGSVPVDEEAEADFVLELFVRDYGLRATDWDAAANVFVDAEAVLLDAASGREIWHKHVDEHENLSPEMWGAASPVRDVVTASALGSLTVEELTRVLERAAQYASDAITDQLREDLRDVR